MGNKGHVGPNMLGDGVSGGDRRERNSALLPPLEVKLTGSDRAFILRAIERIPPSARTGQEEALYKKIRGKD